MCNYRSDREKEKDNKNPDRIFINTKLEIHDVSSTDLQSAFMNVELWLEYKSTYTGPLRDVRDLTLQDLDMYKKYRHWNAKLPLFIPNKRSGELNLTTTKIEKIE